MRVCQSGYVSIVTFAINSMNNDSVASVLNIVSSGYVACGMLSTGLPCNAANYFNFYFRLINLFLYDVDFMIIYLNNNL